MAFKLGKNIFVLLFTLLLLFGGVYSVSAPSSPARIVNGFFSNAFSMLMKWILSLKTTTKTAISGRPMMKFEGGYNVETVFDGSKLGIEPYNVEVLPDGDLLILDSANSNLYKISSSLSLYSRPRLVSGSADGYSGHVDGKLREARMNHPKGLTVDDRGNIYIADTDNMAIRKISDTGVTTIAGGKRGRGVDMWMDQAKMRNFRTILMWYILGAAVHSLLSIVETRQLGKYSSTLTIVLIRIAVLVAAGFFGYMLALLQRRVGLIVSSQNDHEAMNESVSRPISEAIESQHQYKQQLKYSNSWPVQESFVIPDEDEPPSIDMKTPTPKKTYAFMTKDSEKMQQLRQSRAFYSGWDGEVQKTKKQQQQHHHQYHSSAPQTYYEQSSEKTNEIVFGAVQEQDKPRENVVIKPLDHGIPVYDRQNIRSRVGYMHGR
ncbi:hypothetical protein DH2020_003543 [Rehmannia glutinosa]|uniref:NHL repeat-containing protein n=1 Tax=Rehmannia glutinosa TaxID=99300 RepID=A0ABR0XLX6_REHGL